MFNPLRLFRRREQIEEASATAYIEGRATAADEARLRERAESEPGLLEDLDSIRQTVSLLRSAEPVRAPRSFALSEAPERTPARVKRTSRRMALAPAVLAVVAATGVGLLTAGDLTNVVQQGGQDREELTTLQAGSTGNDLETASSDARTTGTEAEGAKGGASVTVLPTPEAGAPMAVPTATVTSAEVPEPMATTVTGEAVPDETRNFDTTALPQPTTEGAVQPPQSLDGGSAGIEPDLGVAPMDITATGPTSAEVTSITSAEDDGISLPLWQMQAAFGALAVAMIALWLFLRRRASVKDEVF